MSIHRGYALLLAGLMLWPSIGLAQRVRARDAGIPMHYEERELTTIVGDISRATGQRFIYGDDLRGRVTITVPGRVSHQEAIELLHAALYLKGFAALPVAADTLRIVPVLETASGSEVTNVEPVPGQEKPITTLVQLEHTSPDDIVAALATYVSRNALALAYPPTSSIILAGTESQVARLLTLVRLIDRAANEQLLVRAIRYRSVDLIADMVDTVFNNTPVAANQVEIWTDARTNQLLVRGHPARTAEVRDFVADMDRPVVGEGLVRVLRIRNRDAEEMADLLQSLKETQEPITGRGPRARRQRELAAELAGRQYNVTVDVPTQSLLVTGDDETFEVITKVIAELDRLPPRVSVDVLVFEINRPSSFKLGFDYLLPLTAPNSTDDPVVFIRSGRSGPTDPLLDAAFPGLDIGVPQSGDADAVTFGRYSRRPIFVTLEGPDGTSLTFEVPRENVSFQAGDTMAQTNILIRPNIVGVSGEEHEVFAGNNIPVPVSATAGTGAAVNPVTQTQNIERYDIGTRLRMKPTVGQEGVVTLELEIEVSDLVASQAGSVSAVGPTLSDRLIESTVRLRPGDFAVLGAAGDTIVTKAKSGIPILMDIPALGWFFSTVEETVRRTDLVAVVQARLLRSADEDVAETVRRRLAFERAISRTSDLNSLGERPFAVLLETTRSENEALTIARAFSEDGFETRVTPWDAWGQPVWDIYLTDLETFEEAGSLARRLSDAGWTPEITALSPLNELAGD